MIFRSDLPRVLLPEVPFTEYVLGRLSKYKGEIAVIHADTGENITFDEIIVRTKKCAAALYQRGLRPGDVVFIISSNRLEFLEVVLAVSACGATLSTCNPAYTKDEIARQLKISPPKVAFAEVGAAGILKELSREFTQIKEIYTFGECPGCHAYNQLLSEGSQGAFTIPAKVNIHDDVMWMISSSGTTGLPKSVMLTSYAVTSLVELFGLHTGMAEKKRLFCSLPWYHSAGMCFAFTSLCFGTSVVTTCKFNVERFLAAVEKYKITRSAMVPPLLQYISNYKDVDRYDTSSLKAIFSVASSLPSHVAEKVESRLRTNIFICYGLTEGLPLTATRAAGYPRTAVGQVCANTQIKIVGEEGNSLGYNEVGEICAKGPQLMKGYCSNPEATSKTIDADGWLHTGDLGKIDRNGFLFIVGRIKELIKYKANQISPTELEFVLLKHPGILDVAVVGIPHPEAGEVPKAFIVRRQASLTADDVHQYLKGKVVKYKYLRGGVSFVPSIPKSVTGKILRRQLSVGGLASL